MVKTTSSVSGADKPSDTISRIGNTTTPQTDVAFASRDSHVDLRDHGIPFHCSNFILPERARHLDGCCSSSSTGLC